MTDILYEDNTKTKPTPCERDGKKIAMKKK